MWRVRACGDPIGAMHVDGGDLVVRGFRGEFHRWRLPPVQPPSEFQRGVERVLRCLPVQFDGRSGGVTDQAPDCEFP
jgi:hypothetical protein